MLRNDVRLRGQWRWGHWSFIINFLTAAHPALTFDFGCLHDSGEFLRSFPLLLFECVRKEKQLQKYSLFCLPYVSVSAINIFGTELHKHTKMKKRAGKTKLRWSRWGCLGRAVQFSCTWSCGATGTNQRAEEVIYHYWHWSCHHTNCALSTVSIARSTNPNLCVTPQQLCVQFMRHFWDTSVCLLQAAHLSSASILSLYSQFVLFFWSGLHFWFGRTCLLTLTHSQSWTFTALRLRLDEVFFGSNAAHFCRRATAFPSDHPCLQKLAHNYSGCHCSTAS